MAFGTHSTMHMCCNKIRANEVIRLAMLRLSTALLLVSWMIACSSGKSESATEQRFISMRIAERILSVPEKEVIQGTIYTNTITTSQERRVARAANSDQLEVCIDAKCKPLAKNEILVMREIAVSVPQLYKFARNPALRQLIHQSEYSTRYGNLKLELVMGETIAQRFKRYTNVFGYELVGKTTAGLMEYRIAGIDRASTDGMTKTSFRYFIPASSDSDLFIECSHASGVPRSEMRVEVEKFICNVQLDLSASRESSRRLFVVYQLPIRFIDDWNESVEAIKALVTSLSAV